MNAENVWELTQDQIDRWKALQAKAKIIGDVDLEHLCIRAFSGNVHAQKACDKAHKAGHRLKPFEVDVGAAWGAPMARTSRKDASGIDLRLTRVDLDSGGYDKGGAYWGRGKEYVYCAWGEYHGNRRTFVTYVRAPDRKSAKEKILDKNPFVNFLRP